MRYGLLLTVLLALVALAQASRALTVSFGIPESAYREAANSTQFIMEINARRTLKGGEDRLPYMTMASVSSISKKVLGNASDRQAKMIGTRTADSGAVQEYVGKIVAAQTVFDRWLYGGFFAACVAFYAVCMYCKYSAEKEDKTVAAAV